MGDQLSVANSCCPVVENKRESLFVAEQKRLVEKQTNSPYRHHRRQSSCITNDAPIPLFCSIPKSYTFYFATLTNKKSEEKQESETNNINNNNNISLLQHGKLQFNQSKNNVSVSLIAPCYNYQRFTNKIDCNNTNSIELEWISNCNITNINWFFYNDGLSKRDRDNHSKLIVSDNKFGLISEINDQFNITKPFAKICKQNTNGLVDIIKLDDDNNNNINNTDIIRQKGYNIQWSTTKNGQLIFGSNGMKYNTCVIKYDRNRELYVEDWRAKYNLIRYGCGAVYPGFISIECVLWSHIHDKWFILPRYLSVNTPYMNTLYKNYGCNVMLQCSENFKDITTIALRLKKSKIKTYKNNGLTKGNMNNNKIDYNYDIAKQFGIQSIKDLNHEQKNEIKQIQKNISKSLCYSDNGVFGFVSAQFLSDTNDQIIIGLRQREKNNAEIETSVCVFNIYGDVFIDDYILNENNAYKGLIIL